MAKQRKINKKILITNEFEITPKKKKDWILIFLTIIIILIMVYQTFGLNIYNFLKRPRYSIELVDGEKFNISTTHIIKDPYISISHEINTKSSEKEVIFKFNIKNEGPNLLDNYILKIQIIDPFGNIRGDKQINLNKDNKNLKIIFNFPEKEERLYDDWKIYSIIQKDEKIYSINLLPFKPIKKESWWTYLIGILSMVFVLVSIIKSKKDIKKMTKND